jgi:hypothetical protein
MTSEAVEQLKREKMLRDYLASSKKDGEDIYRTFDRLFGTLLKASELLDPIEDEINAKTNLGGSILHRVIGVPQTLMLRNEVTATFNQVRVIRDRLKYYSQLVYEFDHEKDAKLMVESATKMTCVQAYTKLELLQNRCDELSENGRVRSLVALSNYIHDYKELIKTKSEQGPERIIFVEDLELHRLDDPITEIVQIEKEIEDIKQMIERR